MQQKEVKLPKTYGYISAFLTFRCNLSCSFCINTFGDDFTRKRKELSGEQWVEGLNKINSRPEVPITFSGGEPFLHDNLIYIVNNLKPELNIDILTNLYPKTIAHKIKLEEFISKVNPNRIKRESPYASIRVSYHPEQMDAEELVKNVKKMKDAGFSIGIWSVLYPSSEQLSAINQIQFRCRDAGIDFRLKEFTGKYRGELYGDYSKYPSSVFQKKTKNCLCKIADLLIAPNGDVYKCHRDLFSEEFPIGNINGKDFQIHDRYRKCSKYGQCHPCDVKVKTDYKQKLGHTSVEIKDVR